MWNERASELIIQKRRKVIWVQSYQRYLYKVTESFLGNGKGLPPKLMGDPRADEPGVKLMVRATIRLQKGEPGMVGRNTNFSPDDGCRGVSTSLFTLADPPLPSPRVTNPVASLRRVKHSAYLYPCKRKIIRRIRFLFSEGRPRTDLREWNRKSKYGE